MRVARAKIQLGRKLHLADNNRGYLPATTREIAAIGDIYYDSDPSPRNYIYQTYSADGVTPQIPPLSDKPDRGQTAETRMGILSANPYVPFAPTPLLFSPQFRYFKCVRYDATCESGEIEPGPLGSRT